MVTMRTTEELIDAYSMLSEMGINFMKVIVKEAGSNSVSFVCVPEPLLPEEPCYAEMQCTAPTEELEAMIIEEEACKPKKNKNNREKKWKKFCNRGPGFGNGGPGPFFFDKIANTVRQIVREELAYALKGEEPPVQLAKHYGVQCDGCEKRPIEGIRYKCTVCEDFDLCEACKATSGHEHDMLEITEPLRR
jgi:hypothetical protein